MFIVYKTNKDLQILIATVVYSSIISLLIRVLTVVHGKFCHVVNDLLNPSKAIFIHMSLKHSPVFSHLGRH